MSNINQPGNYRGLVVDRGLSTSSGGHLQMEVTMQATEKYDEENQVWSPFNFEDCEAQAYLNLITGKEKENAINCRQIMRAFGWDGMAFSTLNNPDSPLATQIQWRMGMETYNEVERCKVQGISAYDAAPGRQVEKLDPAAVRAIDAKYAGILKNLGGGPKPKSATPRPVAPAPVSPDPTPAALPTPPVAAAALAAAVTTAPSGESTVVTPAPEKPKRGRPAAPKAPPAAPAVVTPPPVMPVATAAPVTPMTQQDAWDAYTAKAAGKTDMEITNTWTGIVHEIGGDEKVGADWSGVYAQCCSKLGV